MDNKGLTVSDIEGSLDDFNFHIFSSFVHNYSDFLDLLYRKIDEIVSSMQKSRPSFSDQGEVAITNHIKDCLVAACGFNATVKEINGATDLTVEWYGEKWIWIGEAKLDNGYAYVLDGFKQLTTRYTTAEEYEREGGVLIYCRDHPIGDFVEKMRGNIENPAYMAKRNLTHHDIKTVDCTRRPDFSFFTDSKLPQIGGSIRYRARFIHVGLYHKPEDKSAVGAKFKYK